MDLGDDDGLHIRIDQVLGYRELFTKNIENAIASDKSDQNYIAIGNIFTDRYFRIGSQFQYRQFCFGHNLHRRFAFQTAIAMMVVVERLEIFALSF